MRLSREYDMMASEILQDIMKGKTSTKTIRKMYLLTNYISHINFLEIEPDNKSLYYEIIGKICIARKMFNAPLYKFIIGDVEMSNDIIYIDTDSIKRGCE